LKGAASVLAPLFTLGAFSSSALAECDNAAPASGTTVTCTGSITTPSVAASGSTGVTINVDAAATANVATPNTTLLGVDQNSAITNNGSLTLSGASTSSLRGNVMLGTGNNDVLTNAAGATISTTGDYNNAMSANGSSSTLVNNGSITTTGANAYGMAAPAGQGITGQSGTTIVNTGSISVAGSTSRAISLFGSGTVTNSGSLSSSGSNANTVFLQGDNQVLNNTGTITATGSGAKAVNSNTTTGSFTATINNSGTISSSNGIAIQTTNGNTTLTNSGTISTGVAGGTAIKMGSGNNHLILQTGSSITGIADGGANSVNDITLQGTGTASNDFLNFQTLNMTGTAWNWTGTGTISTANVQTGTLTVTGLLGTATTANVASGATLEATASSMPTTVNDNGTVRFIETSALDPENPAQYQTYGGTIGGSGNVEKTGSGTLILTGSNSYTGTTTVSSGYLYVNGTQSSNGLTTVASGARLGGEGTVGGSVTIQNGGYLAPGFQPLTPATLTINGNLTLNSGSILYYNMVDANVNGSPLNDLTNVNGNLTLAGTINVLDQGQTLGPGVYRIINYTGSLTNNGLVIGNYMADTTTPSRPLTGFSVQTSYAGQVNLINTGGQALSYWDGDAGPVNNGIINGGNGTWRATGDDNWSDANGTANASFASSSYAVFAGTPGTVQVTSSLGAINASGMQFAVDGYHLQGDVINLTGGTTSIVRVGDGTSLSANMTAVVDNVLAGSTNLTKTDLGTLVLTAANTYSGGTTISGGTLQLGNGGTSGAILGDVLDNGTLAFKRSDTVSFGGLISGTGGVSQIGTGTTVLTAANTYSGATTVASGTLQAGAANAFSAASAFTVQASGTLDLAGRSQTVASLANAGVVSLNGQPGTTLTTTGDYTGNGGVLRLNTALGGDTSSTDLLRVQGNTAGNSLLKITNVGGSGAQTVNGIKVIDVAGTSAGNFTLQGDYVIDGTPAVVGGAYAYTLEKNDLATQSDGDWYLRSRLRDVPPATPLYQAGVPLYESYGQVLLGLNSLPSLRQRVGHRYWKDTGDNSNDADASSPGASPLWVRVEGRHDRMHPSTVTGATYAADQFNLQLGVDGMAVNEAQGKLVAGLTARTGTTSADVDSMFGNGRINTNGFGLGGTLTWYGNSGFYTDAQAQLTWYRSNLDSSLAGSLTHGNDGLGYALGIESGQRIDLGNGLALTPQAQVTYSRVRFDSFTDRFGARVGMDKTDSLTARLGLSLDQRRNWRNEAGQQVHSDIYGIVNLQQEFLGNSKITVSTTPFSSTNDRLWGSIGVGGIYSWGRYTVYGEASWNTSLSSFNSSASYKGTVGLRITW
jgi:outer membrane autotransporter protein